MAGANNRPVASKSQFSVVIVGVDGEWAMKSGGKRTMPIKQIYQGGATDPTLINGRATYDALTVTRPAVSGRDAALGRQLKKQLGQDFTVRQQELDVNGQGIGTPEVFSCRLSGVNSPDVDWNSTDESTLELTFDVQSST